MKKFQLSAMLLSCAAFTLFSCAEDAAEIGIDWGDASNGALEVVNTSNTDIVLFIGDRPTESGILGGVRAGATKVVDICAKVSDCGTGGWTIIRGITRDIYNDNISNLTAVTKIDFNAMATYKTGQRYRITIDYSTVGDNAVRLTNKGRVGMELRKNSPEGEKVAFLPKLQQNQMLYTATTAGMTLFPYYVLYNNANGGTVTTLSATSMFESVQVSPRPANGNILTYYFPNDANDSWEKIVGTLKSPVAYITVSHGVSNQSAYFTASGATRLTSQNGYDDIGPGEQLVFEVEAADATKFEKKTENNAQGQPVEKDDQNKPIEGGVIKNLVALLYGGMVEVPILFYTADNKTALLDDSKEPITCMDTAPFTCDTPVTTIYNGYDYTVSIQGSGQVSSGYKAIIKRGNKRDLSGQLSSL